MKEQTTIYEVQLKSNHGNWSAMFIGRPRLTDINEVIDEEIDELDMVADGDNARRVKILQGLQQLLMLHDSFDSFIPNAIVRESQTPVRVAGTLVGCITVTVRHAYHSRAIALALVA